MKMNNQKSLKLNMILNAIKGLMSIVFPLITFPYISKILGVENIGKFNFANSIISYFVLFAGLGISTYAIREGARIRDNDEEFSHFANEMFSINIVSTVVSYVILIILLFAVSKFQFYKSLLLILSLQVVFKTIGIEWIYSIFEDYQYITVRSIAFQVLSLILMFLLVRNVTDINIYATITVISSVGSNILNFFHAKKYCKVRWTNIISWNNHIKPIMILFAMSVTVTIYVSSDTTILGFLCSDYNVGVYAVSTKIYGIIKMILSSVLVVSIPRLSVMLGKNDKIGFDHVATNIYKTLLTVMLPAITGIILLRKQVILIISTHEYIAATTSLAILSIALIFSLGAWFWGQCILVPLKKEDIVFKATIASALLNIVLNFILIPYWKENAAAFTTVLAEGLAYFWCMYEGRKYVKPQGIAKTILKIVIGCGLIIVVSNLILPLKGKMMLYTFLTICTSMLVYFLIELLLKNEFVESIVKEILTKFKRV